jgi:uncharacterized protein DUF3237
MPQLIYEFEYRVSLEVNDFGAGPAGHCIWFRGTSGAFSGDRLKGEMTPGGGDWLLAGADGFGRLDVRLQLRTHDGANIYVQYGGLVELSEKALAWAAGQQSGTEYREEYFFTNPRLETSDERNAWVNKTFFIGQGHLVAPTTVEYKVYRLAN